jgi:orotate phosphoribosyltransferase
MSTEETARLLEIVRERALRQFDEPRELSSGELSRDFIDAKAGLSRGADLALACRIIAARVAEAGIEWDAVGGLTMGADQFAHGIAVVLGDESHDWFVVRKAPKGRGTNQLVEGARLGPAAYFAEHAIPYLPVFTYRDLGIVPVGVGG